VRVAAIDPSQERPMILTSNSASAMSPVRVLRALMLLGISAPFAHAHVDCSVGFECGRVAYGEYFLDGPVSHRLWTQSLDGSQRTLLLEPAFSPGTLIRNLQFDSASHKLYFVASPDSFSSMIYAINVDGTELTDLSTGNCRNDQFSISPDGARIVFRRNCGPTEFDDKIWLMDIDGSNQRLLTSAPPVSNDPTGNKHGDPAFSPDGQFVVFTSQDAAFGSRQVYRSTLDGTTVVALTDPDVGGNPNSQPVYLPDGRIVYASSRAANDFRFNDLYRMDGNGGSGLRLTDIVGGKSSLVVSPDGSHVLFINRPDPVAFTVPPALYLARTDGSGVVALYDNPGADREFVTHARFSPDGTRIAIQLCYSTAGDCIYATRVMDLDGSNVATYGGPTDNVPFQGFGRPDVDGDGVIDGADSCPLAPNGYRVAVELESLDVWTLNYDGSQPLRVTPTSAADVHPRFDSSGKRIVFSSNRVGNDYEIHVMNADGSGVTRLTQVVGRDEEPVMSPDGTRIAFLGTRPPPLVNHERNVWIMNADGTDPLRLTTNQGFDGRANNPVFNHDGTRIAFDTVRNLLNGNNREIYTIRTDGGDELRLTTTAGIDMEPAYSRDGSRIVFISYRDGTATNGEIYTMRSDGSDPRRITNTPFREFKPTFSPDGAQIVFMADYDGSPKLYAMNRDGTGLRRIANNQNFTRPTLAPQADGDADGIGDACDPAFDAATMVGAPIIVRGPGASVEFAGVAAAGTTSFTPIRPEPGALPAGYTLCGSCPAFDITTTATIVPPIRVCIEVPDSVPPASFQQLRLLHGENGQWIDRTTLHVDLPGSPREVCGVVDSLSPFLLASLDATSEPAVFANGFE
jgi:Tol biopolymer transport system component